MVAAHNGGSVLFHVGALQTNLGGKMVADATLLTVQFLQGVRFNHGERTGGGHGGHSVTQQLGQPWFRLVGKAGNGAPFQGSTRLDQLAQSGDFAGEL